MSLRSGILKAFLTAVDVWSYGAGWDRDGGAGDGGLSTGDVSDSTLLSVGLTCRQNPSLQWPGLGYLTLRCTHNLSDSFRLSAFEYESVLYPSDQQQEDEGKSSDASALTFKNVQAAKRSLIKRDAVVLLGHAGSGVQVIGSHLATQLKEKLDVTQSGVFAFVGVDLASFAPENNGTSVEVQLNQYLDSVLGSSKPGNAVTLVTVSLSASCFVRVPQLLTLLAVKLSSKIVSVLSTVSPSALQMHGDVDSG